MKRLLSILLFLTIAGLAVSAMGKQIISPPATLNVQGNTGTSMLYKCVVTGTNPTSIASVTGCAGTWPPSGWTLACADGGEASAEPACGAVYPGGSNIAVSTSKPHAGSHSFMGTFTGDASLIGIHYGSGSTLGAATYHSLYGSEWIYENSNAMFANSDFNWFYIYPPSPPGGCPNGIGMDAEQNWNGNTIRSSLTSGIQASGLGVTAGNPPGGCPGQFLDNGFNYTMPAGNWVQYEFLFVPSTFGTPPITNPATSCNNLTPTSPNCGNGTFQVWVNGSLMVNHLNVNTNGSIPMSPEGDALMGGLITSFIDINNESVGRCLVFSATGAGTCPGTQPGTGAPPPFARWIDDIILLWK